MSHDFLQSIGSETHSLRNIFWIYWSSPSELDIGSWCHPPHPTTPPTHPQTFQAGSLKQPILLFNYSAYLKCHGIWLVANVLCTSNIFRYAGAVRNFPNIVLYESDETFNAIWLFNKSTMKNKEFLTQCGITFEVVQ